ncbi:hypothetical protein DL95DRAFT_402522 [Leptodontidium sp. 2 PMI_412]|nr:hypothetical protein DL95DRAFT_402522 [Leptodontidium sp. 2 PMI_412]
MISENTSSFATVNAEASNDPVGSEDGRDDYSSDNNNKNVEYDNLDEEEDGDELPNHLADVSWDGEGDTIESPIRSPQATDLEEVTEYAIENVIHSIKVDPAQDQIPYLTEDAITYIVIPKEDSDLEEIPDEETRREVSPDILDALAMPPLPRRASTASGLPVLEHIPKPIPHRREYIEISGLVFGLGIWCERYSISRSQYSQIGEDFSDL